MRNIKNTDSLVSIIMPVRQVEKNLEECLDSLFKQTHTNLEIIVIDDNSRDDTFKILKRYRRYDKRLIISRNVKTYGHTVTLNRSLKKAHGKYIAFMNPNDISTPDRIKRQLFYLKRHPKVAAVGTQATFFNEQNKKAGKSNFPTEPTVIQRSLGSRDVLQLESLMINRYLLPKDLLRFNNLNYPLVYRALVIKIMQYGDLANLNQQLYLRRRSTQWNLDELSNQLLSHLSLWLKARFIYDARPSLESLLYPFNNRLKSIS